MRPAIRTGTSRSKAVVRRELIMLGYTRESARGFAIRGVAVAQLGGPAPQPARSTAPSTPSSVTASSSRSSQQRPGAPPQRLDVEAQLVQQPRERAAREEAQVR